MKTQTIIKIWARAKIMRPILVKYLEKKTIYMPKSVEVGRNVEFVHNAPGLVIHPNTTIGDEVKIYQGVTIGRADIYDDYEKSAMGKIEIRDYAIICAGAKILAKEGDLIIGKNAVIGANAVLLCSVGDNEVWAGVPARKIGMNNRKEKQ